MADAFLQLSSADRREALEVAATASGRPVHLLEKDVWVVWALSVLFAASFADRLVFKGGTSLSKGYGAIRRFSEDVDLTYDIRALAPDFASGSAEALPRNRSQEQRWSREIRARLPVWVDGTAAPVLRAELDRKRLPATIRIDGDKIFVDYRPLAAGSGYVRPSVMLEFGARSTGEPAMRRFVACDAAQHLPTLGFPSAQPRIMRVERTFWEKATAAHVYCLQGRVRGDRYARHWHDLARLDERGHADAALRDRALAMTVARHKALFFAEKDSGGRTIDYEAAVQRSLLLVPEGQARSTLSDDYARMVDDGLLLDDPESFDALMNRCGAIADKANL